MTGSKTQRTKHPLNCSTSLSIFHLFPTSQNNKNKDIRTKCKVWSFAIHIKRYISITKTAAHSETFNVKNTLSALLKLIKFDIKRSNLVCLSQILAMNFRLLTTRGHSLTTLTLALHYCCHSPSDCISHQPLHWQHTQLIPLITLTPEYYHTLTLFISLGLSLPDAEYCSAYSTPIVLAALPSHSVFFCLVPVFFCIYNSPSFSCDTEPS